MHSEPYKSDIEDELFLSRAITPLAGTCVWPDMAERQSSTLDSIIIRICRHDGLSWRKAKNLLAMNRCCKQG